MTDGGTASETDASQPPPAVVAVDALVDEVARFWKHAARSSRRALDGTYTFDDAVSDIESWMSASSACALRLAAGLGLGQPPPSTYTGTWSATMTVLPTVSQRPLTLTTTGLRAIGKGTVTQVAPSAVTFEPPVLHTGDDTFTVTVSFANTSSAKTMIFEGDITAPETRAPVTDPVRPNNRDGGPVT